MLRCACFYRPFCGTPGPVRLSVRPIQCPGPDDNNYNNYLVWKWLPLYSCHCTHCLPRTFFCETGHRQLIKLIVKGDLRDKPHGKASLSNMHPLACRTFFHSSLTYFHMHIHSEKQSQAKMGERKAISLKVCSQSEGGWLCTQCSHLCAPVQLN